MNSCSEAAGPALLEIVTALCTAFPDRVAESSDAKLAVAFADAMHRGVQLTTSYSGMGTPEAAGQMIVRGYKDYAARSSTDIESIKGIFNYSAADCCGNARQTLLSHRLESRPEHIFGDVLCRLCEQDEQKMRCEMAKLEAEQVAADGWRDTSQGRCLVETVRSMLDSATFQEEAFCYVHKRKCRLKPSHSLPSWTYPLHLEIAGITCTPWSPMNKGKFSAWNSPCTFPALVHCYHMRVMKPSLLVIENVRAFDAGTMMDILSHDNMYCWWEMLVCPSEIGAPTSRKRKLVFAMNVEHMATVTDLHPEKLYAKLFHQQLQTSAACHLTATNADLVAAKQQAAAEKKVCLEDEALAVFPWRKLLLGPQRLT